MPRVKLAEIVDSDPENSNNSLGTDSSVDDMDDVPQELIDFFLANLGVQRSEYDMSLLWQRWCSQTHTFLTSWGEFSPTLEDVVVLLQLPVFDRVDLTLLHPDSDLLKLVRHFQMSSSNASRYAKKLSKSRHFKKSSSKDKHPKARGSSKEKEVVGEKQDSKRKKITILRKLLS
ncbi:hypothetical protein AHAS_Ahas13G0381600 [Arachis hypogaea]